MNIGLIVLAGLTGLGAEASAPPVRVSVWAAQATQEDRSEPYFDAGLEDIRPAVGDLPYNTYKKVHVANASTGCGQEIHFPLDEQYTLFLTPVSREPDGRVRLDIRVEMPARAPGGKPVNALSTRIVTAEKDLVKFRGLKRGAGELIVVLSLGR